VVHGAVAPVEARGAQRGERLFELRRQRLRVEARERRFARRWRRALQQLDLFKFGVHLAA